MKPVTWLDIANSATTFGILAAIAFLLVILVIKQDSRPKQKSSKK